MKNINLFKFKDTSEFFAFLGSYNYKFEDVRGFKFVEQKQYQGNVLKLYYICMNDGEELCFTVATFKDFHEYHQALLGYSCNKLISWFEDAAVTEIKENL